MRHRLNITNTAYILLCLFGLISLMRFASIAGDAVRSALALCGRVIVPSLFPFFVLSAMLNRLGLPGYLGRILTPAASKLYGISGAGASALLIGLTGGYPTGAAYIADMERSGAISRQEGEKLLAFCNNSGPAFIIGAVGSGAFGSAKTGLLLYAVHIFSALITGLFFRHGSPTAAQPSSRLDSTPPAQALSDAVMQAANALVNVCAFVLCFSVVLALLDSRGALSLLCGFLSDKLGWELHFSRAAITGIFELGNSIDTISDLPCTPESLALCAGILGWGGLSVQFQSISVLRGSKLKGTLHLAGRLLSAAIAAITAYIAGNLFL